jgi:hypothetical protein
MSETGQRISIWFFIGVLLLVYGVLIVGAGLWELVYPSPSAVAMRGLHAAVWWGILLVVIGMFYSIRFRPGKR